MKVARIALPLVVAATLFAAYTAYGDFALEVGTATIDTIEAAIYEDGTFTVAGTASDATGPVEGSVVEFSGMYSLEGLTTHVQPDGTFELTVEELATETSTGGQAVIYDYDGNPSLPVPFHLPFQGGE